MHMIGGLLRLLFNLFIFFFWFCLLMFIVTIFLCCSSFFRISYKLHPSYYQVLKRDIRLPSPAKLTHTSIA